MEMIPTAGRRAPLLAAGVLAGLALLAYHDTFHVPFLLDDASSILTNYSLRHWSHALQPPADSTLGGRPFANLTFAINWWIGGKQVFGYHFVNLCIHLFAGLTLFGVVRHTLGFCDRQTSPSPQRARATPLAFSTAAIWLVHPVLTASVTYISQRTESLMAWLYLLTLYTFIQGERSAHRFAWRAASVLACAAGMATKESMVTAPLMVLLYDRTYVSDSFGDLWRRRGAYYAALASTWAVLAALMDSGLAGRGVGFGHGVSGWRYLLTECEAILLYLKLAVWPHPLVFDYGPGLQDLSGSAFVPAAALLTLLAGSIMLYVRRPRLGFAAIAFFLLLAPTSSVVPIALQPIAENRMYLPLASVVTLGVVGLGHFGGRHILILSSLMIIPLVLGTVDRNKTFSSSLAVWSDTIAKRPRNPRAHEGYAHALISANRTADAVPFLRQAADLDRTSPTPHAMLGDAFRILGLRSEALRAYEQAIRLDPHTHAHASTAALLFELGRTQEALEHFEIMLRLRPGDPAGHYNLAVAHAMRGSSESAHRHYQEALRLQPDYLEARVNYANFLLQADRRTEAENHYREALRLQPDAVTALNGLGTLRLREGNLEEAGQLFSRALEVSPESAEAHHNIGIVHFRRGRMAESIARLEHALKLRPDYAQARDDLAHIRAAVTKSPP